MHIDRAHMSCKFWLDPDVSLAENYGFNRRELREIERLAREYLERLRNEWDALCPKPCMALEVFDLNTNPT